MAQTNTLETELWRGEEAAKALGRYLIEANATSDWWFFTVGGLDYVVSTHIEKRGKRVGGPPAAETASKTLLRAGRGRAVKVVRHLRRMKAHATFWTFPLIEGRKKTAEVVVIVEARDEGEGPLGHTEVIRVLRGCGPGSPRNF